MLHTFTGGADGSNPNGSLVLHSAGLYGTTSNGGYLDNGTLFRMDPKTGQNTVLHTFTGGAADGANPAGGLVADSAGNFYGTTRVGGIYNAGTIFRIDSSGESTLLHSFTGQMCIRDRTTSGPSDCVVGCFRSLLPLRQEIGRPARC